MSVKSANVIARVEPEIKQQVEEIFAELGISASTAINMFYRQVVAANGLPFRPTVSRRAPLARDEMTDEEFNARMKAAYENSLTDEGYTLDEVFSRLIEGIPNE